MKKILHIVSSPRGEASYSIKLGRAVIEKLQEANPENEVKEINLTDNGAPHLESTHLQAFFTPKEQQQEEQKEAVKFSEMSIADLLEADILIIGAPLYNFNIHSSLKAWIDHVVRAGVTFSYGSNGPEGLVKNKKAYIAMSSGGVYSDGPMQSYDFVVPYLKTILGFIGITDVSVFRVEGTSMASLAETALEKAVDSIVL